MKSCILCRSQDLKVLCEVKTKDIARIYKSWLKYDVQSEFGIESQVSLVECSNCALKFFTPCITGSAGFYSCLSRSMGDRYYQEEKSEYQLAKKYISVHDKVLDIGAGCGLFSNYVTGEYTGLDFNPAAIAAAQGAGRRVISESLEEHSQSHPEAYSMVVAFQVVEHIADPEWFVKQCLGVLRPGGLLVLSVPSDDSFVPLQENAALSMPPHHISRWSDECLRRLGMLFGLSLEHLDHERLAPIHLQPYTMMIARRSLKIALGWKTDLLVDLSWRSRVLDRLTPYIARALSRGLQDPGLLPWGHSVTALYRKSA